MSDKTKTADEDEQNDSLAQKSEAKEELILSAVKFLNDPKVQKSPLNEKVAFLESKGLTPYEIQVAISRSTLTKNKSGNHFVDESPLDLPGQNSHLNSQLPYQYTPQVVQASSTWKDYFITSVVFGAISYSIYGLAQTFLAQLLKWPSEEDLELERKRLDEQFDKAFQAIESVKKETQTVIEAVYSQNATIEKTLAGLAEAIDSLKEQDQTRLIDVDKLWAEMESVKKMIPEAFNKSKESQTSLLDDLQNEIRSLKALVGRRAPTPSLTASNSLPTSPGPGISHQTPLEKSYVGNASRSISQSSLLTKTFNVQDEGSDSGTTSQHTKPSVPSWQLTLGNKTKSTSNIPTTLSKSVANENNGSTSRISLLSTEQLKDPEQSQTLSRPNTSQGIESTSV